MTLEQSAKLRVALKAFIFTCCFIACIYGIVGRFSALNVPDHMVFDEAHYVKNARYLVAGDYFFNDHPAFGKLLIGLGIKWLGDTGEGWRIIPAIAGVICITLAGAMAFMVTRSFLAATIAASFIAIDPVFIAYSRTAHMDGMMVMFSALGICLTMYGVNRSFVWAMVGGISVGLSGAMKYNGFWAIAPIIFILLYHRQLIRIVIALLGSASAYVFTALLNEVVMHRTNLIVAIMDWQTKSLEFHTSLMSPHIFSTRWYTWPLMIRPILMNFKGQDDPTEIIIALANPFLVWVTTIFALYSFSRIFRRFILGSTLSFYRPENFLWIGAIAAYFPWAFVSRPQFFYHYMPALFLLAILLSVNLVKKFQRAPVFVSLITLIIVGGGAFFSPIAIGSNLTRDQFMSRAWFDCWYKFCPFIR